MTNFFSQPPAPTPLGNPSPFYLQQPQMPVQKEEEKSKKQVENDLGDEEYYEYYEEVDSPKK